MARRQRRFTIYDMMEEKGLFEANPANTDARDSNGMNVYKKQEYPRMVYHPEGLERVTSPGEVLSTPLGPRTVGRQTELINKIVNNEGELKSALGEGWHETPAGAIAKRNGEELPISGEQRIADLEAQILALQAEKNSATERALAKAEAGGAKVTTKSS